MINMIFELIMKIAIKGLIFKNPNKEKFSKYINIKAAISKFKKVLLGW